MSPVGFAPPWHHFPILKHPPGHAHLDARYCLATVGEDTRRPYLDRVYQERMAGYGLRLPLSGDAPGGS